MVTVVGGMGAANTRTSGTARHDGKGQLLCADKPDQPRDEEHQWFGHALEADEYGQGDEGNDSRPNLTSGRP
jgi:hypothetical protein